VPRKVIPILGGNRVLREKPACFNTEQEWREWTGLARIATRLGAPAHQCTDCTKAYADKMAAAGRCVFAEVIKFIETEGLVPGDESVVGFLPGDKLRGKE